MVTKYSLVAWEFNTKGWCDAVLVACEKTSVEIVADVMDLNKTTVINWKNGKMHPDFPYPNLTNLLKFCNEFDHDVRVFFQLEDK